MASLSSISVQSCERLHNPGDIRITREAFAEGRVLNDLHVVEDGEQALQFLRREAPYAGAARPDLILLDLKLPEKDGLEVLREIKQAPRLRKIPVVGMTVSKADEDICQAYDLNCNCYITKPVDLDQFYRAVQSIEGFWLTVVTLPAEGC